MKKLSLIAAGAVAVTALAFGLPVVGTGLSYAQLGNQSPPIGNPKYPGYSGAGTLGARAKSTASASAPSGPGLSRLPLTTPDVMPYTTTIGDPLTVGKPGNSEQSAYESDAYGTATEKWPYTNSRVAVLARGPGTLWQHTPVTSKPFRQTGKLWMRFGTDWFVCTASLIKKGVLITAAHCVHNYGQGTNGFADEVLWYPANFASGTGGPWGSFTGVEWRVPNPYVNGTDTCQTGAIGVVCNNDIATVTVAPRSGQYAGDILLGWYGYSWNNYSFVQSPAFGNQTIGDITQLGYPVAFDSGEMMQRNNSFGKYITMTGANSQVLKNIQLGSALTGGSSGGPWLVNFGANATVNLGAANYGTDPTRNLVVGVTSWGYTTVGVNVQGASFFGQNFEYPAANYGGRGPGNIGALVNDTCTANPAYC